MRLGVLGGTFNPVHYGHLRAAEEVKERLGLEKVLFVPAGNPPLKSSDLAEAGKRYAMVELAIAGNPAFEATDIEVEKAEKSYTVDTMEWLSARYRGAAFFFILGIDAFLELPDWREPGRLVNLTDFAVIARPPHMFKELSGSPYLEAGTDVLRVLDTGEARMKMVPLKGGRSAMLMGITPLAISATMIRSLIRNRMSIKYLLPENVESFIMSDGLYAE